MTFDEAFTLLMKHEGGYFNHPNDPGGETMFGITHRVARRHGYFGEMKDLPLSIAKIIAKQAYWDVARIDDLPDVVRFDIFDMVFNAGEVQAIKLLQRAVGTVDDGVFGPKTLAAVQAMNPYQLLCRFNGHRLQFYTDLKTWQHFGKGWARRTADNLKRA